MKKKSKNLSNHNRRNGYQRNYHVDVYWEDKFTRRIKNFLNNDYKLDFSHHTIKQQSNTQRRNYDVHKLTIDLIRNGKIIEVTFDETNFFVKTLVRITEIDSDDDWCVVIQQKKAEKTFFIKTIWINKKSDPHYTLDKDKYCTMSLSSCDCKRCNKKSCPLKQNNLKFL